jgi:hypothetical protein
MKTKMTAGNNFLIYSLFTILIGLIIILPSCSKDDNDSGVTAHVMIVNSAQGSSAQDFYLNNAKVNSTAVAYTESSGYITTGSGTKTAEFRNTGSTTATASSSANLEANKYYTFYFTGNSAAKTEDDMSAPPSGKAKVRYINLNSSANSNVDLSLNGTSIASNIGYQSASSFSTVNAGSHTIKVLAAGTNTLYFDLPVTLQAGKIYTIWASGNTLVSSHVIANN